MIRFIIVYTIIKWSPVEMGQQQATCNGKKTGYSDQSTVVAGLSGFANGVVGMVGMSWAWNPVKRNGIDKATADFKKLKENWDQVIATDKQDLLDSQQEFLQRQNSLLQAMIAM